MGEVTVMQVLGLMDEEVVFEWAYQLRCDPSPLGVPLESVACVNKRGPQVAFANASGCQVDLDRGLHAVFKGGGIVAGSQFNGWCPRGSSIRSSSHRGRSPMSVSCLALYTG